MRRALRNPLLLPVAVIAALLLAGELIAPGFASAKQVTDQLTIAAILAFVAAGQTVVVLAGREGIDLSVGTTMSLAALLAGNTMQGADGPLPLAIAIALAAGFGIGCINGAGVTLLRIPPLVMTLGMAGVIQGLLVILTRGRPSGSSGPLLMHAMTAPVVGGIPGILLVWLALIAVVTLTLRRTRLGLALFQIGANDVAARLSGVPVTRLRILAYGLCGMLAAAGGIVLLGFTGSVFVGAGEQYILPSVIAVVIGGTGLAGGSGGYLGTVLGAVVLTLLQAMLITIDATASTRQVIFGLVLLAFMLLYGRERRLRA